MNRSMAAATCQALLYGDAAVRDLLDPLEAAADRGRPRQGED